jgi:Protein of unknown function (DUF2752)
MLLQQPPPSLSKIAQRLRWAILVASLAPTVGAFAYEWLLKVPHSKCLFQTLFGFPSPACGLTRSFMAIARGDLPQAFCYHLFGPFLFAIFLLTSAHVAMELVSHKALSTPYIRLFHQPRNLGYGGFLLAILFWSYYVIRLYARYSIEPPPFGLSQLGLWQSLVTGAQAL